MLLMQLWREIQTAPREENSKLVAADAKQSDREREAGGRRNGNKSKGVVLDVTSLEMLW